MDLIVDPGGAYWCRECFKFLPLYKTINISREFGENKREICPECDGFGATGMEDRSFKNMNIDDRLRSVKTMCRNCMGAGVVN